MRYSFIPPFNVWFLRRFFFFFSLKAKRVNGTLNRHQSHWDTSKNPSSTRKEDFDLRSSVWSLRMVVPKSILCQKPSCLLNFSFPFFLFLSFLAKKVLYFFNVAFYIPRMDACDVFKTSNFFFSLSALVWNLIIQMMRNWKFWLDRNNHRNDEKPSILKMRFLRCG